MNTTAEQKRLFDDPVADAEPAWYWCNAFEKCRYMVKSSTNLADDKCPECGEGVMERVPF